jgi:hypothetical protein
VQATVDCLNRGMFDAARLECKVVSATTAQTTVRCTNYIWLHSNFLVRIPLRQPFRGSNTPSGKQFVTAYKTVCVCEALQLCCWPKPNNRKVWIPHQNSKEHTKSHRERVGREVEKAKSWKLETEKSEERRRVTKVEECLLP